MAGACPDRGSRRASTPVETSQVLMSIATHQFPRPSASSCGLGSAPPSRARAGPGPIRPTSPSSARPTSASAISRATTSGWPAGHVVLRSDIFHHVEEQRPRRLARLEVGVLPFRSDWEKQLPGAGPHRMKLILLVVIERRRREMLHLPGTPYKSGAMSWPSIFRAGSPAPASFAKVGSRSMVDTNSLQTVPAGTAPGCQTMAGTRKAPSAVLYPRP